MPFDALRPLRSQPLYALAFAAIVLLAGLAASLPARRSGRVNPAEALNAD